MHFTVVGIALLVACGDPGARPGAGGLDATPIDPTDAADATTTTIDAGSGPDATIDAGIPDAPADALWWPDGAAGTTIEGRWRFVHSTDGSPGSLMGFLPGGVFENDDGLGPVFGTWHFDGTDVCWQYGFSSEKCTSYRVASDGEHLALFHMTPIGMTSGLAGTWTSYTRIANHLVTVVVTIRADHTATTTYTGLPTGTGTETKDWSWGTYPAPSTAIALLRVENGVVVEQGPDIQNFMDGTELVVGVQLRRVP